MTIREKLEPVKAELEDILGHEVNWYFAENQLQGVDDQYAILNYNITPHFGDTKDHYNDVRLTLYTVQNDDIEDQLVHQGWVMSSDVITDEKLSSIMTFNRHVLTM